MVEELMIDHSIRAVAFDAVGTLIHPDPPAAEVYVSIGRRFGSRLELPEVRARFGAAFAEQERLDVQNGLATSEEREQRRWEQIVASVLDDVTDPVACFAELYNHFGRPDAWRVESGAADILCGLQRAGYPIAMASNYDHRLRGVIAGLKALAPVSVLVISSEVGWRKPASPFFAHLAATLALPPHAMLYVGDEVANDYEGACQAGMQAVLFDPNGRHPKLTGAVLGKLGDLHLPRLP
jgi:putative hydrolase of the HAD superfamily